MTRDRWEGLLDGWLGALADGAARRRFARERAEAEDAGDLEPEEEILRLAAADEERLLRGGPFLLRVVGRRLTQVEGPAGLSLRLPSGLLPLVPGKAVELEASPGAELEAVDARGRRVRLR